MPNNVILFPIQRVRGKARRSNVVLLIPRVENVIHFPGDLKDTTSFTITNEDEASVMVRLLREQTSFKPPEDKS